jgi:hypothetical protein
MKKLTFITGIVLCLIVSACSKKSNPTPTYEKHAIKITASGTEDFATVISTATNLGATPSILKSITVASGTSFEFSADVEAGNYVFLKVSSDIANHISYKIYDNGNVVLQADAKEFSSHSTETLQYQAQ